MRKTVLTALGLAVVLSACDFLQAPSVVEASFAPAAVQANAGEVVSVDLRITASNYNGQGTLSLTPTSGFTLVEPRGSFSVRDGVSVPVRIQVGDNVAPGDYQLPFVFRAQGLEPKNLRLTATVRQRTTNPTPSLQKVAVSAPARASLIVGRAGQIPLSFSNPNAVPVAVEVLVTDAGGLQLDSPYREAQIPASGSGSLSFTATASAQGSGAVTFKVRTLSGNSLVGEETVSVSWSAETYGVSFTASPASAYLSDEGAPNLASTVSYTPSGGASGIVALEAQTAGWSVSPTYVNVTGSGQLTLRLTPPSGIAPGNYSVAVKAVGTGFQTTFAVPVTLSTVDVSLANSNLTASPTAVLQGAITPRGDIPSDATFTLSLEGTGANRFALSSTSAGLGSFSTTLSPLVGTPPGTYDLLLRVSMPGLVRKVPFRVTVVERTYTASLSPASLSAYQGGSASATLSVAPQGGYSGTLALAVRDATTGSLVPWATVTPGSVTLSGPASYPVTLNVSASAPTGTHNLALTLYGEVTKDIPFVLTVDQATFDISLRDTSFEVATGSSARTTLYLTTYGAFSGSISLSLQGARASDFSVSPNSIDTSAQAWAISLVNASAPSGTYSLTLVATSGSIVRQVPITINVP